MAKARVNERSVATLDEVRRSLGLSYKDLARRLGTGTSYV